MGFRAPLLNWKLMRWDFATYKLTDGWLEVPRDKIGDLRERREGERFG